MPASDIAQVLGTVFKKTEEQGREAQEKFEKEKSQDIEMYRSVLMNPESSPEQRTKAAEQIEKLRSIKKDKPFSRLAGFLNIMHGMRDKNKQVQPGSQPMDEKVQTAGGTVSPTQLQTPSQGQGLQGVPASASSPPLVPEKKQGGGFLGKVGGVVSGVLGSHPRELALPPVDTSVFSGQNPMTTYRKQLEEAVPGITKEQLDRAVEQKFGAIPKPTATGHTFTKKGTASGKEIPEGETDVLGNPIDRNKQYDVLQNASGDKEYISSQGKHQIRTLADETGKPADFLVDMNDPTKLVKIGAKPEQAEYKIFTDPETQEQFARPVPRYVGKTPTNGSGHRKPMQPPPGSQGKPISQSGTVNGHPRELPKPPGISLGKKDTNTARSKAEQALVVVSQGNDLIAQIQANRDALGPLAGRISSLEAGLGSADERVRGLYTALKSFAALQPALHGSRGIGMQKEFEKAAGRLADNPDAAIAAIRSLMQTAKHFADAGGEGKNVGDISGGANAEKEAQDYLDSLKKK